MSVLKMDPTRTVGLRRRFWDDIRKRMLMINKAIRKFLVEDDAFGLAPRVPFQWNMDVENVQPRAYQFQTDVTKMATFRHWLQEQIDKGLLEVEGGDPNKPWTAKYVTSAYRQGIARAYADVHKEGLAEIPEYYTGTRDQFLRDVFAQPEVLSKVALAFTRAFEQMDGLSGDMSAQLSRILADGLANGRGPAEIAREMTRSIIDLSHSRAMKIARTEVIHAHAEGQLDAFEALEIDQVSTLVEWATAGDPCSECASMSKKGPYTIKQARGLIPLHPSCRCCWTPVVNVPKLRRRR